MEKTNNIQPDHERLRELITMTGSRKISDVSGFDAKNYSHTELYECSFDKIENNNLETYNEPAEGPIIKVTIGYTREKA